MYYVKCEKVWDKKEVGKKGGWVSKNGWRGENWKMSEKWGCEKVYEKQKSGKWKKHFTDTDIFHVGLVQITVKIIKINN